VNIFRQDTEVVETPDADYRWRVFHSRAEFKTLIDARVDGIEYTNFKNTVKDHDLHELYSDFWQAHRGYQRR